MTVGAPRAVGFDPKTREIAETLARQAGLSLRDWLAGMAGGEAFDDALAHDDLDAPASSGDYLETPRQEGGGPSRFEAPGHPGDEMARMTAALDRLSQRIETAESRATMAISGVDRTVRGALSRLGDAERDQVSVAARFEGALAEARDERDKMAQRLARIEDDARGPRSAEALRSLEQALGKVAGHFYGGEERNERALADVRARIDKIETTAAGAEVIEAVVSRIGARLEEAEARTSVALRELQATFAALDTRLSSLESDPQDGAAKVRLEQVAADLATSVDAARAEMDERLSTVAQGQFERVDKTLDQMTQHVRAAEQRSAQAIERMGREVADMAGAMVQRVQGVERRTAEAIEQVGGDVARIAQTVELKLGRADAIQAQALEKLGEEIARITERLAERIGASERRSAAAIDEVGDHVAKSAERLSQRHERASEELAERIRLSEERTARILDEARSTIEHLVERHRQAPPPPAFHGEPGGGEEAIYGDDPFAVFQTPPPAASPEGAAEPQPEPEPGPAPDPCLEQAFGSYPGSAPEAAPRDEARAEAHTPTPWAMALAEGDVDAADGEAVETREAGETATATETSAEDFGARLGVAASQPAMAAEFSTPAPFEPASFDPPAAEQPPGLTTREAVGRARAAAVAADPWARPRAQASDGGFTAAPAAGLFAGGPFERLRRRRRGISPTALGVGLAAAFGLALGGFWIVEDGRTGALSGGAAQLMTRARIDIGDAPVLVKAPPNGDGTVAGSAPSLPQLAVAIAPTSLGPTSPPLRGSPAVAPGPDMPKLYAAALAHIEAKDKGGLDQLRKVASLGYAPAEFYLAKLYETGGSGLAKDPAEARRWTQRAADGGEAKAMHNLALDYFEGAGGPKDSVIAASWFRKAAELGLVDSQFNLGRLYEEGFGVAQNPAEAYKWYLIAGRLGDGEARASAARLKAQLSQQARTVAERTAVAFRAAQPGAASALAATTAPSGDMVTAERALSALGYYQGPTDGSSSPALRLAISAYQHDQGLPITGAADATTIGKLSALTSATPPPS